jgi:nickel-type superoxide dismutase maturation protease
MTKIFYKILPYLAPFFKYKISGNSMSPTLHSGQTILVNRLRYWFTIPKVNDIVAVNDPRDGKVLIKRITKIEGKGYFVEGDNKKASTDSRVFGMIERRDIVGKVILLNS